MATLYRESKKTSKKSQLFLAREKPRTMKLFPGAPYTWVWCDSYMGWAFYLFFTFINPIYTLQVRWDEAYRKAYLPSILFGCFNVDWMTCSAMYIEQLDDEGNEWARTSYVFGQTFKHGSYTLKKADHKEFAHCAMNITCVVWTILAIHWHFT